MWRFEEIRYIKRYCLVYAYDSREICIGAFCFIHGTYQIIIQAKRLCAIVSLIVLLRGLSCFHDFLHGASLCTSPCNACVSQSCVLHPESVLSNQIAGKSIITFLRHVVAECAAVSIAIERW